MKAEVGDEILVRGAHVGNQDRHGVVVEVHGADGEPPYVVRWSDGHEGLFFPSSDASVSRPSAGGSAPGT